MKIALITVSILIILAIALLFILGKYSQKGQAAGLVDGSLSRCSDKPNCVCSEYANDTGHYIEPVSDIQDMDDKVGMATVVSVIQEMNGSIHSMEDNYIAATFKSSIFGFVDDLEIRIDMNRSIMHIRSASRVGYGDGGVNARRVALFKQLFRQKMKGSDI